MMAMFDFLNKLPTLNELTGSVGEWLATLYTTTMTGALVLHDVLIDGAEGHTSQIDLVMVGNKGVYVIEVKMFAEAKIYGDTKKPKWHYYSHGKRYEIYSPIRQNGKHVEYLNGFLKDFGDVPLFSVIAMVSEDFKVSGDMPPNTGICNSFSAMEKLIYRLAENSPVIWDDTKKKEVYQYIKDNQHIGKDMRLKHKESVVSYKNELDELKTQKKCPYCNATLVLRKGKYGEFYGCPNYPKCKYTQK